MFLNTFLLISLNHCQFRTQKIKSQLTLNEKSLTQRVKLDFVITNMQYTVA